MCFKSTCTHKERVEHSFRSNASFNLHQRRKVTVESNTERRKVKSVYIPHFPLHEASIALNLAKLCSTGWKLYLEIYQLHLTYYIYGYIWQHFIQLMAPVTKSVCCFSSTDGLWLPYDYYMRLKVFSCEGQNTLFPLLLLQSLTVQARILAHASLADQPKWPAFTTLQNFGGYNHINALTAW